MTPSLPGKDGTVRDHVQPHKKVKDWAEKERLRAWRKYLELIRSGRCPAQNGT